MRDYPVASPGEFPDTGMRMRDVDLWILPRRHAAAAPPQIIRRFRQCQLPLFRVKDGTGANQRKPTAHFVQSRLWPKLVINV